ncbi:putative aspartokinase [Smittium mucronatum]|uniref:Aspartokinase n=1 Tax=Smittium mucronatum TaxID=133383 RepID=A0A1R0H482_9FUNG|nr:putative aspartokinase [Smittium mucronatum]
MTAIQARSDKPTLVIKFGGTSIGKFPHQICGKIIPDLLKEYKVIVVCSARSTEIKAKGTTSLLMKAADSILKPELNSDFAEIVREIKESHIDAGNKDIKNAEIRAAYIETITEICTRLEQLLTASMVIDEVSVRTRDIIIGTGEHLSCEYVRSLLLDNSISAQVINLEKAIVKKFDPTNLDQNFYNYLSSRFADLCHAAGNDVAVVTGYFGPVPGGILYSIGRGYTDLTAALIAAGVEAQELQIWKEVDGVFSADPRKVSSAKLLQIITPEEAAELTYYGSEVVHPFTMEQVMSVMIPIRIKNVQNPSAEGTIISPDLMSRPFSRTDSQDSLVDSHSPLKRIQSSPHFLLKNGYMLDLSRRQPTAITIKDNILILNIHSNRRSVSYGFFESIFSALNKYSVSVDLISTSEVHVSMAISFSNVEHVLASLKADLSKFGQVDVIYDKAILSLVGKQMRNMVGIAGRMFAALANAGVSIDMISQGSSEINISCVISASKSIVALNAVHDTLMSEESSLESDPEAIKDLMDPTYQTSFDGYTASPTPEIVPEP